MTTPTTVLVTGGSGFIAGHTILQLLAAGHEVRATVRSLAREAGVREALKAAGVNAGPRLTFVAADLTNDGGWAEAVAGCAAVLHMASPFPPGPPKHEDDLVIPAREGTLRVLRAAREAGVRRLVLTSSFAAIGYGHPGDRTKPFDETDWTDADREPTAYVKSKTLAERAAWDFLAREGGALELAVVNPVVVLGPVLGSDFASSILLLARMLEGGVPVLPRLTFGVVDVRDVADLHLRAMTSPAAVGERFLATAGDFVTMRDAALVLRRRLGASARRVSTVQLPDWVVRAAAPFVPAMRSRVSELGKMKNATSGKARRLLGWSPRSAEDAIVATAESLLRHGLVKGA